MSTASKSNTAKAAAPAAVLFGAPGSGKGTQADILCKQFNLAHVATGDIFRENLKNNTDLGKLAKNYMDCGELVPDEVTVAMLKERLLAFDSHRGFILDGFPRTLPQAEALARMIRQLNRRVAAVLYIKVSDEEIVNRLSGRFICRACQTPYHLEFKPPAKRGVCDSCGGELYQRADDNPDTVRTRLKTFHQQTSPLIDYYGKEGILTEVNGEGSLDVVTAALCSAMEGGFKKVA